MLASAASLLNLGVTILDVGDDAPAKQVYAAKGPAGHIDGSFSDAEKIKELASHVDILTVEIEHVDVDVLEQIESFSNVQVHPSARTIRIIQDKLTQKRHFQAHSLPVARFLPIEATTESVGRAIAQLGLPLMLKSRTLAYDGRGNSVVHSADQIKEALAALGNRPLYAEKWASFVKEVSVMVVRSTTGEIISYPPVETVHKDNICHLVFAPLRVAFPDIVSRARKIAEEAVMTFTGAGVYGVELFLLEDGEECTQVYGLNSEYVVQETCLSMRSHPGHTTLVTTQ